MLKHLQALQMEVSKQHIFYAYSGIYYIFFF